MMARAALVALRAYKILLSPLFSGSCRFTPSCADYTSEAIRRHGFLSGAMLGARRLARCRPFGGSGFDPVPLERPWAATTVAPLTIQTCPGCRQHAGRPGARVQ